MKIYTRKGDKGMTALWDGGMTSKSDYRFVIVGEIDELSSRIGMLCALLDKDFEYMSFLRKIQGNLQFINSHIVTVKKQATLKQIEPIDIKELEYNIDSIDKRNEPLTKFILPGIDSIDAQCHVCRTQCRKVERFIWLKKEYLDENPNAENIFKYLNRLSDFFFVLARFCTPEGMECFA